MCLLVSDSYHPTLFYNPPPFPRCTWVLPLPTSVCESLITAQYSSHVKEEERVWGWMGRKEGWMEREIRGLLDRWQLSTPACEHRRVYWKPVWPAIHRCGCKHSCSQSEKELVSYSGSLFQVVSNLFFFYSSIIHEDQASKTMGCQTNPTATATPPPPPTPALIALLVL